MRTLRDRYRVVKRGGKRDLVLWRDVPERATEELPTVMIVPPFGRSAHEMLVFAAHLVENGFRALRFDFCNHVGLSEGGSVDFSLSSACEDVWAVTEAARRANPDAPIAVLSASLGSRVSFRALRGRDDVAFLGSLVGVYHLRGTLRRALGRDYLQDYLEQRELPPWVTIHGCAVEDGFVADALEASWSTLSSTVRDLACCPFPLVEFAAEEDRWVRRAEVVESLREGSPAAHELVVVREASHNVANNPPAIREAMQGIVRRLRSALMPARELGAPIRAPELHELVALSRAAGLPGRTDTSSDSEPPVIEVPHLCSMP